MMLYLPIKKGEIHMEIDYKVIGERIREARKKKGWSQERFSEEIDVAVAYVSRIERGSSQVNLNRLAQISKVLDTSIEYFIKGVITDSPDYLDKELYNTLLNCSPEKQRLIYNIARIVSNANFV